MKAKISLSSGVSFLLFIVFFPLDFLGNFQREFTRFLFSDITEIISLTVFNKTNIRIDFSSDSLSMFILIGILIVISILIPFFIRSKYRKNFNLLIEQIVVCYLIIILFKYGIDKIFKTQFYLPEPNILYSRFGNLDKDILFWSVIGTSGLYSVLTGFVEVLAAVLLIFRNTKIIGSLLSSAIFLNITFINFGFDISGKLFSLILFLMSIFCLKDDVAKLYRFLILKKLERLEDFNIKKSKPWMVFVKTLVVGIILVTVMMQHTSSGSYNDDMSIRPDLHGAYKVLNENSELKYVFFHRRNYLILMDKNDEVSDFKYAITSDSSKIILEDYNGNKEVAELKFQKSDSILTINLKGLNLKTKRQNWKEMNVLKPLFHWNIEDADND